MSAASNESAAPLFLHLDLKGAAPKVGYLERLLTWLQSHGEPLIHGVVIEYEDQLPPYARLDPVSDPRGHWTTEDIERLRSLCGHLKLELVPLVQTVGHLEYLLKYPERVHLRELEEFPQCLRLSESADNVANTPPETLSLIFRLLDHVLALHPDCPAIHLGGDEVWHLAKSHHSQQTLARLGLSPLGLYLRHMRKVVDYVQEIRPGLRMLIWDDMLRSPAFAEITQPGELAFLQKLEAVIWQYGPELSFPEGLFERYRGLFGGFWAGSAFKGATSSHAKLPSIPHHVQNNVSWKRAVRSGASQLPPFRGAILTGWTRFDHFTVLCEILPAGIPSLICCIQSWKHEDRTEGFTRNVLSQSAQILGLDISVPLVSFEDLAALSARGGTFPGSKAYTGVYSFVHISGQIEAFCNSDVVKTWCTEWNVQSGRVSRLHVSEVLSTARSLQNLLEGVKESLVKEFCDGVFPEYVVREWSVCFIAPLEAKLAGIIALAEPGMK